MQKGLHPSPTWVLWQQYLELISWINSSIATWNPKYTEQNTFWRLVQPQLLVPWLVQIKLSLVKVLLNCIGTVNIKWHKHIILFDVLSDSNFSMAINLMQSSDILDILDVVDKIALAWPKGKSCALPAHVAPWGTLTNCLLICPDLNSLSFHSTSIWPLRSWGTITVTGILKSGPLAGWVRSKPHT